MIASTRLFVSLLIACVAQVSAQTSLSFNLGAPGTTIQDQFVFADGGVTATATAYSSSQTSFDSLFEDSQIVQRNPGIGVRNPPPNYRDYQNHYDFVLLVFSEQIDITSVDIRPSTGAFDLDTFYWLGNIITDTDLDGVSFAGLTTLGFGSRIDNDSVTNSAPRSFGITTPSGGVNALLIGARIGSNAHYDNFKIAAIHGMTVIPEPTTAGLLVCSLAFALRRRRA